MKSLLQLCAFGAMGVFALAGCAGNLGAPNCTDDDECPTGSVCEGGDCHVLPAALECEDADEDGYFSGPACEASAGLPDCDDSNPNINPGVADECGADMMGDGVDQNCMNGIDDGCSCDGTSATREACGAGLCAGTRVCIDGAWGNCEPSVTPVAEDCGPDDMGNTMDEDCDGRVDEGCTRCPERLDGMGLEMVCPGDMPVCSSNGNCAP